MKAPSVRVEVALIAAAASLVGVFGGRLPRVVPAGLLLLAGALILLFQGFLRDLVRVAAARGRSSARRVSCVCVESAIGLTSIAAGAALSLGWEEVIVPMGTIGWPLALAFVGLFGTAMREIVFDWRTGKLRRETDHMARVVWRD